MKMTASIPVRFDEALRERLDTVSEFTNISSSELIRIAVREYLDKVEDAGELRIPFRSFDEKSPSRRPKRKKK